jgi:NAD(P)-dependent dehydrogenase (short-subunit alcohol dehydrogenase family)
MTTDQNAGRVAVITGASSGIGEATARALASEG